MKSIISTTCFFLVSLISIAYPKKEEIEDLVNRIDQQTISSGYPFREVYSSCLNPSEAAKLYAALDKVIVNVNARLLNRITYARQLDNWGDHSVSLSILKQIKGEDLLRASQSVNYEYSSVLGVIALNSQNPQLALKHYKSALEYAKKSDQTEIIQAGYSNVGNCLNALERSEEALIYFQKALRFELEGVNRNSLYIRLNIALTQSKLQRYEDAKRVFLKTLDLLSVSKDAYAESRTLMNLGDIYFQQDSLKIAQSYFSRAKEVASKNGLSLVMIDLLSSLSRLEEKKGNFDSALRFKRASDSISYTMNGSKDISSVISALENDRIIALESLKKELVQTRLNATKKERNYVVVCLFLLSVALIVLMVYFRKLSAKNRHLLLHAINSSKPKSKPDGAKVDEVLMTQLEDLVKDKHIHHDPLLTIEKLAKALNTNRSYLSQSINNFHGVSFRKWINELRIQEAKILLLDEKQDHFSIEAIAEMVGFSSISSFNENFKKVTGLTPSYFRKGRLHKEKG